MNHTEKVKLARTMSRTANDDKHPRYGKFQTAAWDERREGRRARVKKQQTASHQRAVARREAAAGTKPSLRKRAVTAIKSALRRQEVKKRRSERYVQAMARLT